MTLAVSALLPLYVADAGVGAAQLAAELAISAGFVAAVQPPVQGFYLQADSDGLSLRLAASSSVLRIDFAAGALDYRRQHGGSEAIVRAMGFKAGQPQRVVDATAGLGRDAFILAAHGAEVVLLERQPLQAVLLADALRRGLNSGNAAICQRMRLLHGSAQQLLGQWASERPAVVYLDPMFPHRRKSALVKQEMQWLQQLAGADEDADALLLPARQLALQRVVVKRPDDAPPLAGIKPSGAVASRGHRFDIYPPLA